MSWWDIGKKLDGFVEGLGKIGDGLRALSDQKRLGRGSRTSIANLVKQSLNGQLRVKNAVYPDVDMDALISRFTGWVYACVNLNSGGVSSVPLRLYTKRRRGKTVTNAWAPKSISTHQKQWLLSSPDPSVKQRVAGGGELFELTTHPILDLLHKANPLDSGMETLEMMVLSLDLIGACYNLVIPNSMMMPVQLWPLLPHLVNPIPDPIKGIKAYKYGRGIDAKTYNAEMVIRGRYASPKSLLFGYSPLQAGNMAAILEGLMMKYNRALLENDARPDFFLKTDSRVNDEQYERFMKRWMDRYSNHPGTPGLLEGGLDIHTIGFSPRELMAPQYMQEVKALICAIFGVPLPLVEMTSVSRASAETAEFSHQRHAILPRCRKLQSILNYHLVPRWNDENLFLAFDDPVLADALEEARIRRINLASDFTVPNEERSAAGYPEIGEAWASQPESQRRGAKANMREEAAGNVRSA